jgi:predicted DNA-binding protein
MEVHLTAETEKKLKDLAAQSGRATDEIVEDAMAGYFDEVVQRCAVIAACPCLPGRV